MAAGPTTNGTVVDMTIDTPGNLAALYERRTTLQDALARTTVELSGPHLAAKARLIASLAHAHQRDKAGAPYWGHLLRVAYRAESIRGRMSPEVFDRYEVEAVALLHDVLEDTPVTFDELRIAGIPVHIAREISLLTHRGQPRHEYLGAIAASPLARLVKIADTLDNTDPVRLRVLDDETRQRLERKYSGQMELLLDAAEGSITPALF